MPYPDIHVDEVMVRALLAEQFSDLSGLELGHAADGFDNSLRRVSDELVVRLPRREVAVAWMEKELKWLPVLAPTLPLPISEPVLVGRESPIYPHPWSITKWFDGAPAHEAELIDPRGTAELLANFMTALHQPAPDDAPSNSFRDTPLAARIETFESRVASLKGAVEESALREVWEFALRARPWEGPAVLIHGDLHPLNLLIDKGELSAVIDFGDLCAGDPATDVACAWMFLAPEVVQTFLGWYQHTDPSLVARALGWATLFGIMFTEIGVDGPSPPTPSSGQGRSKGCWRSRRKPRPVASPWSLGREGNPENASCSVLMAAGPGQRVRLDAMTDPLNVPTLEGTRLRLEPLATSHASALASAADEDRQTYRFTPVPKDLASMNKYVEGLLADRDAGLIIPFAQVDVSDGRAVGVTRFMTFRLPGGGTRPFAVEIGGTWLAASAQRSPVNTEAKLLLMTQAFDVWKVTRVDFKSDARNERSRAAILRIDASFEGVLRHWQPSMVVGEEDMYRDTAMYSVLDSEWPVVRARLQLKLR